MVINFSNIDIREQPVLVLRNIDGTALQTLGYAFNINMELNYNEVSILSFDIPAFIDGDKTPHYDDIIGTRIVDAVGYGQFVLVNPTVSKDGIREVKSCKAYSLEYELTYKKMSLEEGTYNFWNTVAPGETILGIILSYLPSWKVGSIDDDLIGKYRTFSVSNENIYNFIKSVVQKTYGCIFDFDTYNRKINVHSVISEPSVAPVYLSHKNLVKEIELEEDTENIFTVLDVNGADGVTIRSVNPTGTNKIYNLDYFMNTSHFSESIINKWNEWKTTCAFYQLSYYNLTVEKMLKTAERMAVENNINELTSVDLAKLENQQALTIEFIASFSDTESDEYAEQQQNLSSVNSQIELKKSEIAAQQNILRSLKAEENELTNELKKINQETSFEKFFDEDELVFLDRYFKEDSISDSSFVAKSAEAYTDADKSHIINNVTYRFSDAVVTGIVSTSGKTIYTIDGGWLRSSDGMFSANVVSACIEAKPDGNFVLTGHFGKGVVYNDDFPKGCISMTGTGTNLLSDSTEDISGAYTFGTYLSYHVQNAKLYFTQNTTEYERFSVEWDLYEYGHECLNRLSYPSYSFDVSTANFFALEDFRNFASKLVLGGKAYLELEEDKVLEPILVGVVFNFEDLASADLKFSDTYSLSDSKFSLVDLLDKSISMGKSVDTGRFNYNSFIDSGASTAVKDFMQSALDVAKNAILSSSNMAVSWDGSGIRCRRFTSDGSGYEPEQIAIINNSIVYTDDAWQSAKMAIGHFVDTNLGDVWGIVAPHIVGTLIAGSNLVIDTDSGCFRVDSSGVHIDSLRFFITHGDGSSNTITEELDSRDDEIAKGLSDALDQVAHDIKAVADGQIVTYYQAETPNAKLGDLWYVTGKNSDGFEEGKLYRFNGSTWDSIADPEVVEAVRAAGVAQATADKKIVSFYQVETPVVCSIGDIWYVTGKNADGYAEGKLYRYDGTTWDLVEDGDIETVKNDISKANKTLSQIINSEGYLKSDMMSGVIDSSKAQMKSAAGNVLFDSDGIWLMNSPTKETATKAIWMNENGMLFGSGRASSDPADTWTWKTAINHEGIIADAIAAGTLSGMKIVGGELNIGDGKFVVDSNGNLTATSGTFSGTVQGATYKDSTGTNMMSSGKFKAGYLELKGMTITNNSGTTTFKVDSNGNVTMNGNITLGSGSSINWKDVNNTNLSNNPAYALANTANSTANTANTNAIAAINSANSASTSATAAKALAEAIADGTFSGGTFIDQKKIYSPTIYTNSFNVYPKWDGERYSGQEDANFSFYGYFDYTLMEMFKMSVGASIGPYVRFQSPVSAEALWDFKNTTFSHVVDFGSNSSVYFNGTVDFSSADIEGLNLTAKFG